jgi:hypothetical protein
VVGAEQLALGLDEGRALAARMVEDGTDVEPEALAHDELPDVVHEGGRAGELRHAGTGPLFDERAHGQLGGSAMTPEVVFRQVVERPGARRSCRYRSSSRLRRRTVPSRMTASCTVSGACSPAKDADRAMRSTAAAIA